LAWLAPIANRLLQIVLANEILFVKGRLKFGGSKNSAPFPSMVVVFDSSRFGLMFGQMDTKGKVIR
jgi:site-specific DNA-methyltransferase (adenine-specific)